MSLQVFPTGRDLAVSFGMGLAGVGRESILLDERRRQAQSHFFDTASRHPKTSSEVFDELAAKWRHDTAFLSSIQSIAMHPAYQSIIGMGPVAIPLILADLAKGPDHWFWALNVITRLNPMIKGEEGDMERMTNAWLQWGRSNGWPC